MRPSSLLGAMTSAMDLVAAGRGALASGDWPGAREAFMAAVASGESPEALEGLGMAAWWLDDAETIFRVRARAYRLYCEQRRPLDAARVATTLAWDYGAFRGEHAVANGWLARARRMLEGLDPTPSMGGWRCVRLRCCSPGTSRGRAS
jgi:hypothetical protein